MEEIVFVTHNKGKAKSAEKYFDNLKISTYDFELDEPRSDDVKEIATAKVMQAYKVVGKPCIALDTGFFIEALNGFPRAFVNFSLDTIGIDGILKLMQGKENRKCKFEECLAYYDGKEVRYFYGKHPGNLATKMQGVDRDGKWSDLWYVFKPEHFDKTLAEMDDVERENRREIDGSVESMSVFAEWYKKNREKDI
jgi:XTP/dITP diphosphohydrolase